MARPRALRVDEGAPALQFGDLAVELGHLVVQRRVRGALRLQALVEAIDPDYIPEEIDWGPPVGKEV